MSESQSGLDFLPQPGQDGGGAGMGKRVRRARGHKGFRLFKG